MSQIRDILSRAQQAEVRGRTEEAVQLLRQAAEFYRARNMGARAQQMARHTARLEGSEVEPPLTGFRPRPLGEAGEFADDVPTDRPIPVVSLELEEFTDDAVPEVARAEAGRTLYERAPTLADAALDAWCSFCCKPKDDVGPLVAGPAGAFICSACVAAGASLLGADLPVRAAAPLRREEPSLLETQRAARERIVRRRAKVTLILGPEGVGKSYLANSLGDQLGVAGGDVAVLDVTTRLTGDDERRAQHWLAGGAGRQLIIAARGVAPKPVLTLAAEHGPEHVYDTSSLHQAVAEAVSPHLVSKVEAVVVLERLELDMLRALALLLAEQRGVTLPEAVVSQLIAVTEASGRGAHELVSLVARISPGSYR